MNNNIIYSLFLFLLLILFSSCKDSFNNAYNNLIEEKDFIVLEHPDYSSQLNKYYEKIYKMGKKNNNKLLDLAIDETPTNWRTSYSYRILTKGDLAISLLIDINKIDDDKFYLLMPADLRIDYEKNGVVVWWDWIHKDIMNRKFVINQLKAFLSS